MLGEMELLVVFEVNTKEMDDVLTLQEDLEGLGAYDINIWYERIELKVSSGRKGDMLLQLTTFEPMIEELGATIDIALDELG